ITTALYAVIAILAALRERDASGLGQHIDLALFDVQVSWLANLGMNFLATGKVPQPMGNAHPTIVPYQSFATADRPLVLAIGNDGQFAALAALLGQDWAQDPRFATNAQRVIHRAELCAMIEALLLQKGRAHWLARFDAASFPFGPVQDMGELAADPQLV